jgi:nitrate/nitrite-specific signal transduction histidine kinase
MRPIPLPTVLRTLQARWSGLLAVDWAIDASAQALLDSEVRLLGAAARVIDDAVSNASRHGRATEVIVRVGAAGLGLRWLRIRVQDNGSGPVQASPVRGSAALVVEQMHGTWTLNGTDEGGAILVVDLPADRLMVEAEPPRT